MTKPVSAKSKKEKQELEEYKKTKLILFFVGLTIGKGLVSNLFSILGFKSAVMKFW